MADPKGAIEIVRGDRVPRLGAGLAGADAPKLAAAPIGKPYAVYVADGRGNLQRTNHATAKEARSAAAAASRASGWPVADRLAAAPAGKPATKPSLAARAAKAVSPFAHLSPAKGRPR